MEQVPVKKPFFKSAWGIILIFFILLVSVAAYSSQSKKNRQGEIKVTEATRKEIPTATQIPEQKEVNVNTGSTKRASTPEGEALFRQIEQLSTDGAVKGKLFTEFAGDPIVDANPQTQSVQLGLQYDFAGKLPSTLKNEIAVDFDMIKAEAEKNARLLMPDTKQLRLFVITYHDKTGKGRGELQQMYIDDEPQWSEWK